MRIDVNQHWPVYLDFGRADSLSLQLYWTYHRLLHMRVALKYHALPVYKKNRIASLLCIFESTIRVSLWIDTNVYHLYINPILRIGLIHQWSIDSKSRYFCKQNMTSLSIFADSTVVVYSIMNQHPLITALYVWEVCRSCKTAGIYRLVWTLTALHFLQ